MHASSEPDRSTPWLPNTGIQLRAIPGGYDIDKLPIAVPRAPGELLESWLHRAAYRYGVHARDLLKTIGIPVAPQRAIDVRRQFDSPAGARAASLLGTTADLVLERSGLVAELHGLRSRFASVFGWHPSEPGSSPPGWCPECLDHDGHWREAWADPFVVICELHQQWLRHTCPQCGAQPYDRTFWQTSLDSSTRCTGRIRDDNQGRYGRRCGLDLRRVPRNPADPKYLALQRRLHLAAKVAWERPESIVTAAGMRVSAASVFDGVLELVGPGGSPFRNITRRRRASGPDEYLIASFRAPAIEMLDMDAPRASAYLRRHGLLDRHGQPVRLLGPRKITRANPQTPFVTALWLSELRGDLSPSNQLQFRLGSTRPRYPDGWQTHGSHLDPSDARPPLPLPWIPQVAWAGALNMPGSDELGLDEPHGRAFISLCLARYGTTRSWSTVAAGLGFPAQSAKHFSRYWSVLRGADAAEVFLQAIDELFHRVHDNPPPIDYHRRRMTAWDPHEFADVLGLDVPDPALRRSWALWTGGLAAFAPPGYARDSSDSQTHGDLRDGLHRALARISLIEPLDWTPT